MLELEGGLAVALAACAAWFGLRHVLRLRRSEPCERSFTCPKTGATVVCQLRVLPDGPYIAVDGCSGMNPQCTASCLELLNRGVPLLPPTALAGARHAQPTTILRQRASDSASERRKP